MTRVLIWWSGGGWAVTDVAAGLGAGLEACGVEVGAYRTDLHLIAAGVTLDAAWRQQGRPASKYSQVDVVYVANQGVLERALRGALCPGGLDWVILVNGGYCHPDYVPMLRRAGFRVALVATEAPYEISPELALARHVDVVFTMERSAQPIFRTVAQAAVYLPHAWSPKVHTDTPVEVPPDVRAHDVVFVGTGFHERQALFRAIEWTGIDLGLYGEWSGLPGRCRLRQQAVVDSRITINEETAALYRAATVGINLHRRSVRYSPRSPRVLRAESLNPRGYELAATGCFHVSDWRPEVDEVFAGAVPLFRTPDECAALVRRALREPAWREDCAARARERVIPHSWVRRAAQVLGVLDDVAHGRRAA